MRQKCYGIAAVVILCSSLALARSPDAGTANLNNPLPEVKLQGVGLKDAIDFVRDVSGANIHVDWKSLEADGVSQDTPITLQAKDIPLRRVLSLILADAGGASPLGYYVNEGVIEITTQQEVDHDMITRVFPIEDLMTPVPDFPAPVNFDLTATATGGSGSGGKSSGSSGSLFTGSMAAEPPQMSRAERADQIIALIRDTVYPEIWRENGGPASIRYFDGKLVVTAPRYVIAALGG